MLLKLDTSALRKAKIAYSFGLSECNRVTGTYLQNLMFI